MRYVICKVLLLLFPLISFGQPRHFGSASQSTLERINEIEGSVDWATRLAGLAAAHSLVTTDPVEDFVDVLNTDESNYRNLEDFFTSLETVKQASIRDAIDRLLLQDELDDATLSNEERGFWEDFRNSIDLSGHAQGHSIGDPHYTTFDGYQYDLQTLGEFILCRSLKSSFEVQVRQKKYKGNTSINSAVAMNLHGQHISFYISDHPGKGETSPLYINGKPWQIKKSFTVFRTGGAIQKFSDHYFMVIWETGEKVSVNMHQAIDIVVNIPVQRTPVMQGLMGNCNKNKSDDLSTPDGRSVEPKSWSKDIAGFIHNNVPFKQEFINAEKAFTEVLAFQYSDAWRVSDEKSLFTYPAGLTTANFTDRSYPSEYNSISKLSSQQIQTAKKTCEENGVKGEQLEACIYDLAFTGDDIFTSSGKFLVETSELLEKWGTQNTLKEKAQEIAHPKNKLKSLLKKKLKL